MDDSHQLAINDSGPTSWVCCDATRTVWISVFRVPAWSTLDSRLGAVGDSTSTFEVFECRPFVLRVPRWALPVQDGWARSATLGGGIGGGRAVTQGQVSPLVHICASQGTRGVRRIHPSAHLPVVMRSLFSPAHLLIILRLNRRKTQLTFRYVVCAQSSFKLAHMSRA